MSNEKLKDEDLKKVNGGQEIWNSHENSDGSLPGEIVRMRRVDPSEETKDRRAP